MPPQHPRHRRAVRRRHVRTIDHLAIRRIARRAHHHMDIADRHIASFRAHAPSRAGGSSRSSPETARRSATPRTMAQSIAHQSWSHRVFLLAALEYRLARINLHQTPVIHLSRELRLRIARGHYAPIVAIRSGCACAQAILSARSDGFPGSNSGPVSPSRTSSPRADAANDHGRTARKGFNNVPGESDSKQMLGHHQRHSAAHFLPHLTRPADCPDGSLRSRHRSQAASGPSRHPQLRIGQQRRSL